MHKLVNGVRIQMTKEEEKYFLDLTKKKEKTLEELKKEKIIELKNSRKIYKQSVFINGLDLETISNKQNLRDNIILGIHPFKEEDARIFKNEIIFISKFWDNKKAEINNATTKTKLKNINTKFIKEEKEE